MTIVYYVKRECICLSLDDFILLFYEKCSVAVEISFFKKAVVYKYCKFYTGYCLLFEGKWNCIERLQQIDNFFHS